MRDVPLGPTWCGVPAGGAVGSLFGTGGRVIGALAGGLQFKEAQTSMLLADARFSLQLAAARPDGALLFSDALMVGQRQKLAAFFLQHRIPSATGWSDFPESGHLLSYGPERRAAWRRVAYFVDKIVKGAHPAELPIELATVFETVINRHTATAMHLSVPHAILLRADRGIE